MNVLMNDNITELFIIHIRQRQTTRYIRDTKAGHLVCQANLR